MNDRTPNQLPWRIIFAFAAAYNLAFAAWAMFWPNGFFELFDLAPTIYPGIWSCLGMVIGVFGLGYAHVAWRPERGDVLIVLGLIGKVLGPIGWLIAVRHGELPPRTFPLILLNDLIWWYPFLAYLLRRVRRRRALVVGVVVIFHLAASLMLLAVSGGTEMERDLAARALFIQSSPAMWTVCWFLWAAASLGLMAFFIAWAWRLSELRASLPLLIAFCAVAVAGFAGDLASEIILLTKVPETTGDLDAFAAWTRRATLLGAGFGNGCYCLAGVGMSAISRKVRFHTGALFYVGLAVWAAGFALSLAVVEDSVIGMMVAGAALMLLFIPWAATLARRLDAATSVTVG